MVNVGFNELCKFFGGDLRTASLDVDLPFIVFAAVRLKCEEH